jgi:hypothetical protein
LSAEWVAATILTAYESWKSTKEPTT